MIKTKVPYNIDIINHIKQKIKYNENQCDLTCEYFVSNAGQHFCKLSSPYGFELNKINRSDLCKGLFIKKQIDNISRIILRSTGYEGKCDYTCYYFSLEGKRGCALFNVYDNVLVFKRLEQCKQLETPSYI